MYHTNSTSPCIGFCGCRFELKHIYLLFCASLSCNFILYKESKQQHHKMNGPQNQKRRPPAQQASSSLLSDHENSSLFNLLGKKCVSLATGVVQVYLAYNGRTWQKKHTGVCCFVKDNPMRSYYIRVYSLRDQTKLWEQELFNQFKYSSPRPYFHTFDTDQCRAGLNFASESEAAKFKRVLDEKVRSRQDKRVARSQSVRQPPTGSLPARPSAVHHQPQQQQQRHHQPAPAPPAHHAHTGSYSQQETKSVVVQDKSKKGKKNKKKKVTKADIGMPSDFKHVGHVGWDPNKGFDMNNMDPDVKQLFMNAGITEEYLQDKENAQFIYDFIEKQGGIEAVKKDREFTRDRGAPPPPPNRGGSAPPPPPRRDGGPPPPPPTRRDTGPPPPPQRRQPQSHPPPPPSSRSRGPPPPLNTRGPPPRGLGSVPPPPPVSAGVPPPPPVSTNVPPPPPVVNAPAPPSGGGRSDLLAQIRQGNPGLKSVGERSAPSGGKGGGGRGALLDQIRQGSALKKPGAYDAGDAAPPPPAEEEGLAGALARALQKRENAIQSGSDSDFENEDSEDEWSD